MCVELVYRVLQSIVVRDHHYGTWRVYHIVQLRFAVSKFHSLAQDGLITATHGL